MGVICFLNDTATTKIYTGEELFPYTTLFRSIKNTEYKEPYSKKHQIIKWFWKAVETYDQKQLSHLVLFATGTSRIPAGGFAALESNRGEYKKFTIQATDFEGKSNWQYPMAHTCFNRITLPMYPTYEILKANLDFVVNNEILGFGIAAFLSQIM